MRELDRQLFAASSAAAAKALIDSGANVGCHYDGGDTPLHHFSRVGDSEIATVLVEAGADVNARDDRGAPPLHEAADEKMVRLLLEAGARVHALDGFGYTALHKAQDPNAAWLLLGAGSNPNARTQRGQTPLHTAAQSGRNEVVAVLLAAGADPNAMDNRGESVLAAVVWWIGTFAKLYPDSEETTSRTAVVETLINAGAEVNVKASNKTVEAPWAGVGTESDPNVRTLSREPLLHVLVHSGHANVATILIEGGADPNARDDLGATALHWAAAHGHAEIARRLLAASADVNARRSSGTYHIAMDGIRNHNTSLFLNLDAEAALNEPGATPLHWAALSDELTEVVRVLLDAGANPNACDENGATPLHWASAYWNFNIEKILRDAGADPELRNNEGLSSLEISGRSRLRRQSSKLSHGNDGAAHRSSASQSSTTTRPQPKTPTAIAARPVPAPRGPKSGQNQIVCDELLLDRLRTLRRSIADELSVPPYIVFRDQTLREMARDTPTSREELAKITGVGARKLERFGDAFLDTIREYLQRTDGA